MRGVQGWVPRARRGLRGWGVRGRVVGARSRRLGVGALAPGSGGLRVWGLRGRVCEAWGSGSRGGGVCGVCGLRVCGRLPRAGPAGVAAGRGCPWPAWKDFVAGRGAVCLASRFALEPHCGLFVLNGVR